MNIFYRIMISYTIIFVKIQIPTKTVNRNLIQHFIDIKVKINAQNMQVL